MDSEQAAIVHRWLKSEGLEAEFVLGVLVQTLVGRHVDCQIEKTTGRLPTRGGQPRFNALVAAQDALHEGSIRNTPDDARLAEIQKLLLGLLTEAQFAAEKKAGLTDDEPPTHMRLVTD